MAYPSATLYRNKLPTGTAGIGFYDAEYPDGDRPVDEYDLGGGITMIVEQGSANGSFMAIELADSVPWRFGNAPIRQAIMGFGRGAVYTQSVDTTVDDPVDPITGTTWEYKNAYTVKADSGWRYLQKTDGGFRALNTNLNSQNMWVYFSSMVSATGGTGQWKSWRVKEGSLDDLDAGGHYGQIYGNYFHNLPNNALIQFPANNPADSAYSMSTSGLPLHPIFDEGWSLQTATAFSGSFDNSDGYVWAEKVLQGVARYNGHWTYPSPAINTNTGCPVLSSTYPKRWNWAGIQDFSVSVGAVFNRGDEFIQFGSAARLRVTTTTTVGAASQSAYDLPITKIENSGKKAHSIFWGGRLGSLSGKYLHYLDNAVTLNSDALVGTIGQVNT